MSGHKYYYIFRALSVVTFKQFLIESFDTVVPYNWSVKQPTKWVAKFTVGEWKYFVIISNEEEENSYTWGIVFDIENRPPTDELFSLSGTGQVLPVFSAITEIVKDFVSNNPDVLRLEFTAKEESRKKFYDRWSKRLSSVLGWPLRILPKAVHKYILTKPDVN